MKDVTRILKGIQEKKVPKKTEHYYMVSGFLRTVHNLPEDFIKTEELFNIAQSSLAEVNFNDKIFSAKLLLLAAVSLKKTAANFDEVSNRMKKVVEESNLRESGKRFVEKFGIKDF